MIGEILSQDEINALLGVVSGDTEELNDTNKVNLTDEEKDALGEIGNISMGTSATTLFTLLNERVSITTPRVKVLSWDELAQMYPENIIAINVDYREGLTGANLLLLKEEDVKIITDIMMGGDGTNTSGELSELHLSAIAEAMNQMVGSASTSMSQMLDMKIDISPPQAYIANFNSENIEKEIGFGGEGIVQVAFSMKVGTIIDSEIMQILPIDFAKSMVSHLMSDKEKSAVDKVAPLSNPTTKQGQNNNQMQPKEPVPSVAPSTSYISNSSMSMSQGPSNRGAEAITRDIDVQMPQFPNFDTGAVMQQKENMDIIMDVPLEVTVELGRTNKRIREILEFTPGTIVELDRLAGEPIDVLVNGKFVAKGEVVVIDENFGIRITDIINPEHRI